MCELGHASQESSSTHHAVCGRLCPPTRWWLPAQPLRRRPSARTPLHRTRRLSVHARCRPCAGCKLCAPRRPTTLPAAAPPQAPFHTSFLLRRLSATHCGRTGERGHPGRVSGPTSLGLFCAPGAARQGTHVHGREDAADGSKGGAGGAHAAGGGQERRHRLALQAFGHVLCGGARVSCCMSRRRATCAAGSRTVQVAVTAPSRAPMAALEPRADSTRKMQSSGLLPTSPMVGAKQSERGSGGVALQRVERGSARCLRKCGTNLSLDDIIVAHARRAGSR